MNNHQNIKVSEALKKGKGMINIPCYSFLFFFFFIAPAILLYIFRNDKNHIVLIIGGISSIVIGIALPILWWAIHTVKYKIWATRNVRDIHRFYKEAQSKNLIKESEFYRKLEIKSNKQKLELSKFYERLKSDKVLIIDKNDAIAKETNFKSTLKWNILIYVILVVGSVYLYVSGTYNPRFTIIIIAVLTILIAIDIYKIFKYKFILKIDSSSVSYKDDKTVIYWKDIVGYYAVPGIGQASSKLIIATNDTNHELVLENYGSIKLNKIIDVLNENKHRFEINQSMR